MAKDIVKKETTTPSVFAKKANSISQIDRSDILIPKLLLMQGLSELVAEEKAQMGDVVNSVTTQIIGGKDKVLTFIPLLHFKDIAKFEILEGESKPKFKAVLPWNTVNAELPWDGVENGVKVRYMKRLNFYVLLESEITSPTSMPFLLSFTSTSYQNGRKLVTHFAQAEMANLEPYSYMFNLTSKKEKNDKGIYYIYDVMPTKPTPETYAPKINLWVDVLSKGMHKVDESDLETPVTASPNRETPRDTQQVQF